MHATALYYVLLVTIDSLKLTIAFLWKLRVHHVVTLFS